MVGSITTRIFRYLIIGASLGNDIAITTTFSVVDL